MYTKRVKSGLAVTEHHLRLMDENLRRAKASSRNDFVEQAIRKAMEAAEQAAEVVKLDKPETLEWEEEPGTPESLDWKTEKQEKIAETEMEECPSRGWTMTMM